MCGSCHNFAARGDGCHRESVLRENENASDWCMWSFYFPACGLIWDFYGHGVLRELIGHHVR